MRLTYRDGIFIAVATFAENHAPQQAGFSHHPGLNECKLGPSTCKACRVNFKKGWWTKRAEAAVRLSAYADEHAKKQLVAHIRAVEMSKATDADIEIPHPPGIDYYPYQRAGVAFMTNPRPGIEGILLGDEMGLGKAGSLDSKILTPTGWRRMGDVKVGDQIINSAGTRSRITGVFPQGLKKIFRVKFQDGSSTECCDEHLWAVNTPLQRHRGRPYRILPLAKIRKSLTHSNGNRQHFIPIVNPITGFEDGGPRPIDSYLLGYILGNGGITGHTPILTMPDQETADRLASLLPKGVEFHFKENYDWSISRKNDDGPNPLTESLRQMDLMGKHSYEKHIPRAYLFAPLPDRTAVLQGLLDSDGHVRPADNNIEYSTSSKQLAEDVVFLVRSLGGTAAIRKKPTTHRLSYRMSIALPDEIIPFKLSRKASIYRPRSKYKPYRAVASVTYLGKKPAQCIAVDATDRLYLADDFIVTHNTPQALGVINFAKNIQNVLVVCPAALRPNWLIEARRWLVKDERRWVYHVVDEDEPVSDGANFIIANYNRITIGYQSCKGPCGGERRKDLVCPICNGTGDGPSHPLVCSNCNGKKTIYCTDCRGRGKLATTNLKIYQSLTARRWDILIVDECHFIKNEDAARSRAILGNRLKNKPGLVQHAEKKLFLTGTPVPNRPVELWPVLSVCAPKEFGSFKNFTRRYCAAHEEWVTKTKKVTRVDGASNLEELQERLRATCMLRRLKRDVLKDLPPKTRQIISLAPTEQAKILIAEELDIWQKKFGDDLEMVQEVLSAAEDEKDPVYEQAAQKLKYIQNVAFMEMAGIRKQVAVAKLPGVIEHISNMWREGVDKVVCFAHHKEVIRGLADKFGSKAVLLYGETKGGADPDDPKNERQQAIRRFQSDPSVKLFIGGLLAAGTGITLTASSHVVFAELDWTPSNVTQAEDRCHRIGQKDNVLVQHLILDGSLDARMVQMLLEKQAIADRTLDKSTDVAVSRSILEIRPEAPVEPVPAWRKLALKEAMESLAQRRDPNVEGSHGFSQFDGLIGQKLATQKFDYTDKQAHLAWKFAKRYRRQLDEALQKRLEIYEAPTLVEDRKAKTKAIKEAAILAKRDREAAMKKPTLNLFEEIQRKARAS